MAITIYCNAQSYQYNHAKKTKTSQFSSDLASSEMQMVDCGLYNGHSRVMG